MTYYYSTALDHTNRRYHLGANTSTSGSIVTTSSLWLYPAPFLMWLCSGKRRVVWSKHKFQGIKLKMYEGCQMAVICALTWQELAIWTSANPICIILCGTYTWQWGTVYVWYSQNAATVFYKEDVIFSQAREVNIVLFLVQNLDWTYCDLAWLKWKLAKRGLILVGLFGQLQWLSRSKWHTSACKETLNFALLLHYPTQVFVSNI